MSQTTVWNFQGATTQPNELCAWETNTEPVTEIQCGGGLYLFLINIAIDRDQLDSDLFLATLDGPGDAFPSELTYHTREHTHTHIAYGGVGVGDVGNGPRLVYQATIQYWVSAHFDPGTITLAVSHPASISMTVFRLGMIDVAETMGMVLR